MYIHYFRRMGIFEYKSFEITVIRIGIPQDLIESTN